MWQNTLWYYFISAENKDYWNLKNFNIKADMMEDCDVQV